MQKFDNYNQIKALCSDCFDKMDKLIFEKLSQKNNGNELYKSDLCNYLLKSSKQIRSCLIFLFAKALNLNIDSEIIKLAAAVEIIHNATLIHDDIIDEATKRRGTTTLHLKYENKLAVISGDFLLTVALDMLVDLPPQIMKNFSSALQQLVQGEINQYFSKNKTPTISEYIKKSQSKTAALFVTALKSLADLKAQNNTKTMENFANHFGIAFQIKDDIKNFICNETQKPTFNDLEAGIYTAPVIYAFGENSNITELSTNEILNKIQNSNAMNQTQNLLNTYLNQALKDIDFVSENNYKQAIICLCKMLESK